VQFNGTFESAGVKYVNGVGIVAKIVLTAKLGDDVVELLRTATGSSVTVDVELLQSALELVEAEEEAGGE
jgi:hypothetical protein